MPKILAAIGRFSARHRLVVVAAWVLVLAVFTGIAATSMDMDGGSQSMPSTAAGTALDTVHEQFPDTRTASDADTLTLVLQTRDGEAITDPATAAEVRQLLSEAEDLPHVRTVSDPFDTARPMVSEDRTTVLATLTFRGVTDDDAERTQERVVTFAEDHREDFRVEVGGAIADETYEAFGPGEALGVVIAFVVLLITFGSLLAAGANLLVAFVGVGIGTVGVLAWSSVHPIGDTTITLPTMLGLAVGIDYSLFILTRFRAELRSGRGVVDAVGRAVGTAGTAVVFAGLTVIIALAGLSVTGIGTITDMGIGGAFGVLVAVLAALTLLPVLLRSLGHRALSRKDRRRLASSAAGGDTGDAAAPGRRSFLRGWGTTVTRYPLPMLVGAVLVLAVVAVPFFSMKTAANIPGGSDPDAMQRHAYDLTVDEFGGVQSPLVVLAEGDGIADRTAAIERRLADLDHVRAVAPAQIDAAGDAALITVVPTGGPIADGTKQLVQDIRDDASSIEGVELRVTGETAIGIDTTTLMNQALIKYVIVIVVLSFLLLIVMFRSILVPLFATLGYLLSVAASFGALTAVFQWGWLDAVVQAPQGDPMLSILPIILVGVLFGLAMDYQVFLVSRIREEHLGGLSPRDAIVSGFAKSAPVLVAAAFIMAFVFGGFASSTMVFAAETAFGLLVGVLADAFLVRMVVMPALLSLTGRAAWWMPRWMQWLPDLDTEGHGLDAAEPARATERPRVRVG